MSENLHKPLLSLPSVRKDLIAKQYMQQSDLDTQVQDKWQFYRQVNAYGTSPYLPYEPLSDTGGETPEQPDYGTWNVTHGTFSEDTGILTHDGIGTISVSMLGDPPVDLPIAFAQRTELFKVGDTLSFEVLAPTVSEAQQLSVFSCPLFLETAQLLPHPISDEDWNSFFIQSLMGGESGLFMYVLTETSRTQDAQGNIISETLTASLVITAQGQNYVAPLDITRFPIKLTITKQASGYLVGYQHLNGIQEVIQLSLVVDDLYPTINFHHPVQLLKSSNIVIVEPDDDWRVTNGIWTPATESEHATIVMADDESITEFYDPSSGQNFKAFYAQRRMPLYKTDSVINIRVETPPVSGFGTELDNVITVPLMVERPNEELEFDIVPEFIETILNTYAGYREGLAVEHTYDPVQGSSTLFFKHANITSSGMPTLTGILPEDYPFNLRIAKTAKLYQITLSCASGKFISSQLEVSQVRNDVHIALLGSKNITLLGRDEGVLSKEFDKWFTTTPPTSSIWNAICITTDDLSEIYQLGDPLSGLPFFRNPPNSGVIVRNAITKETLTVGSTIPLYLADMAALRTNSYNNYLSFINDAGITLEQGNVSKYVLYFEVSLTAQNFDQDAMFGLNEVELAVKMTRLTGQQTTGFVSTLANPYTPKPSK